MVPWLVRIGHYGPSIREILLQFCHDGLSAHDLFVRVKGGHDASLWDSQVYPCRKYDIAERLASLDLIAHSHQTSLLQGHPAPHFVQAQLPGLRPQHNRMSLVVIVVLGVVVVVVVVVVIVVVVAGGGAVVGGMVVLVIVISGN